MRPLIGVRARAALTAGSSLSFAAPTRSRETPHASPIRVEPGRRAVDADRRRTDDGAARELEFADRSGIEGMDGRDRGAIKRAIEFAPLPRRHDRPGGETQEIEHRADLHGIGREHFSEQGDSRLSRALSARRLDGTLLGFEPGEMQHRARQHVLGFRVCRHAETGDVDPDDAHPVDFLRQEPQRNARRCRDAEVHDDDGVVFVRVGELEDRVPDILEELARDERLRIERHITDRALRPVKVRGEGQAVDATGRAAEDARGPAHAQSHAQRAEGGAHALRLIVRTDRIVVRVALERLVHPRGFGGLAEMLFPGMAAGPSVLATVGRASTSPSPSKAVLRSSVGAISVMASALRKQPQTSS